jgi:invasion protein IalB
VICQSPDASRSTLLCRVLFEAFSENGQRVVAAEILRDGDKRVLVVTTPLGTQLTKPLEIKLDQMGLPSAPYEQCQPVGCQARLPLNDALLASLKKAKAMTIAFDFGGKKVTLPVSLAGLGLALAKADI